VDIMKTRRRHDFVGVGELDLSKVDNTNAFELLTGCSEKFRKANYVIKLILENQIFDKSWSVYTPPELITSMLVDLGHIKSRKKWLVLYSLEFVLVLHYIFGVSIDDISFVSINNKHKDIVTTFFPGLTALKIPFNKINNEKFIKETFGDMKFNNIVGNPPFKNKNEKGGSSALWRKILLKAWDHLSEDGYICFVAPRLPITAKDTSEIFQKCQIHTVYTDIHRKYFPTVGSSFYAWIVQRTPQYKLTKMVDEQLDIDLSTLSFVPKDFKSIPIINKFFKSSKKFNVISSSQYLHTQIADGKSDDHLRNKKTAKNHYLVRRSTGDTQYSYGAVEPDDYYNNKAVFTYSGYPGFEYSSKTNPCGTIKFHSGHILLKNKTQYNNLVTVFNSKLYRFIQEQISTGGMKGAISYQLTELDIDKKWTDSEIYKYFKLSKKEICQVEDAIK